MLNTAYINRQPLAIKRDLTPEQLAQQCLAEARNDPARAIVLAGRRAHGAKMRATVHAIGTALLRASEG